MPQERKYASSAARQSAYRKRCERARRIELRAKGLPALPAISTMPGWPRWNAIYKMAHALMDGAVCEQLEYFDGRSDNWKEGERGEDHQERTASAEAVRDGLDELIS